MALARAVHVSPRRVKQLVFGKRSMTAASAQIFASRATSVSQKESFSACRTTAT